jgi:menaquinol-cytochrome c reductase cytochrome b/c subunit
MNDQDKQAIHQRYQEEKEHGVKFYPDIIYKDAIVSFAIFILLVGLAVFVGVAKEPAADPSDTSYVPRPEWYFLFLFEMLKFFPGQIEIVGTAIIPGIAILLLFLLPFIDRRAQRHPRSRPLATLTMSAVVVGMVALTVRAVITTTPQPEVVGATYKEQVAAGQKLFEEQCAKCHGQTGEGGEVKDVEGLEGTFLNAINSDDYLFTRTDETTYNVVDYGQPGLGMPAFGLANGGPLNDQQISAIVAFVRSWDSRIVVEEEAGSVAALAPGEIPDYEKHVAPLLKRRCFACHREGAAKNNFVVSSYQTVMTSGDHAPDVVGGDLNSNLILMINRQKIEAGGPMPPTKALAPQEMDIITRWVQAGALPVRAETPTLTATVTITGTPHATGTVTSTIVPGTPHVTGTVTSTVTPGTLHVTGTITSTVTPGTPRATGTVTSTLVPGTPKP